ncbi:uncharacterized protein NECHADRAFT_83703 [Fusarium vanettenii 77-13-4]|uniref:FAD dependent oxidoreductase domain-containing protein n=1 Tax=Fusarium vanettenii (strain ATCC MYA-4622 / CBS 123669 / FGSC 9596 / NRRL 45880 / 77-13-4) TaxID=660122 RepID=C7YYI6_FUSV7|nr:uncharacterized protein NECHADRAFT_83703 [Fusarium vanettenii 77-13-4]EEU43010.1 hypothetical protein NECHADRAFT_83703 [Fusarium vanettenii 77-13-4]
MTSPASSIIIIGAGVFGLSSALHLQQRGYRDIKIFDKQDYHASEYSPFNGGDSASSDSHKVIRSAYGDSAILQDLANRAIDKWKQWNKESGQELFQNIGWARLTDIGRPQDVDIETFKTMSEAGLGQTQYFLHSEQDLKRAEADGWGGARLDQFQRRSRGLALDGVFDSNAGLANADLACKYALDLIEQEGAETYFGDKGELSSLIRDDKDARRVIGIVTKDGERHFADLVIVAAGPFSPLIVPELKSFMTTTAGNFVFIKVPEHLQHRYRADVFPTWAWNYAGSSESGGLTGFPLDRNGILKISYRSLKWTNPSDTDSETPFSAPATAEEVEKRGPPLSPIAEAKDIIRENLPDLVGAEITAVKMCWYAGTVDLDFVIDRVLETGGLLVVTGGSFHGFKFLPVLGEYVVDVLEGKENKYTQFWRWRTPTKEQQERILHNTQSNERVWAKQKLATPEDLKW